MKTLTKTLTKILKTMRALFQVDQVQPKAVLVLLLLAPVLLSSCEDFDYSFPEIADDAKPRHVYYKAGKCESPFTATLPTDKTEYLRLDTPTLRGSPVACKNGSLEKSFSHWDITYSNSNGEHKPGDKIPFTRHGKYFNATAIWECMRETYDLDGGTGEIVPACKDPNQTYTLSDGKSKDGKFVYKEGYYLDKWQVVNNVSGNSGNNNLGGTGWKAPSDDSKPMPTFKAVWKPVQVTVSFNGGGQTFQGSAPSSVLGFYDSTGGSPSVTLPNANTATTQYYTLASWNTKPNGSGATIASGSSVAIKNLWQHVSYVPNDQTATLTLFAQWTGKPVTVTYDANGGSSPPSGGNGTYGQNFTLATAPTKTGYTFEGWCTDSTTCNSTNTYNAGVSKELNQNNFSLAGTSAAILTATLYAIWKPILVSSITISPASTNTNKLYIAKGGSLQLTATVDPSYALNPGVDWAEYGASTNGISVDSTGKVTVANSVSYGTNFVIKATAKDGSGTTAKAYFIVKPSPEKMITVPTSGSTPITFPMGTNDNTSPAGSINHKFVMSQTEVTYELWKKVYDWANKGSNTCQSNGQYCYTFANSGKEGSHGTAGDPPTTAKHEPVTNVNWRDTIVWSNAYTEWYNAVKNPSTALIVVYYTDNNYNTPLRTSTSNSTVSTTAGSEDKPYIKAGTNNNTDMANNTATGFRLPTSQEWEFAARLRTDQVNYVTTNPYGNGLSIGSTTYYFTKGNSASGGSKAYNASPTDVGDFAWYDDNSSKTHDVATKTANALGIYDMSGNALEWCFDHAGTGLVYRGGSWSFPAQFLRVGDGNYDYPNAGSLHRGFRVARTTVP